MRLKRSIPAGMERFMLFFPKKRRGLRLRCKRQIMGRIEVPCEVCQNIHETHRDSPGVSVSFRYRGQQSPTLTGSAGECR